LYHEKPSICNVYVKFHNYVHWSIGEILLFIKGWLKIAGLQHCQLTHVLDGTTDRGVVRLGSQHNLCGSKSVAYSSTSLRACWLKALWTSFVTATATVTDIYRLNWYKRCSALLETCVFSVSLVLKDKHILSQHRKLSSFKLYTQCLKMSVR